MDETEGFQCLGHSNWTICIPLNHFCFQIFPSFSLSYWEANSYTPEGQFWEKGNFSNPKLDETEDFKCLGQSNWTIFSPLHLSLFENFPTLSLSYWEANSYFPLRANNGKREFFQPQKWIRQRVFSACNNQTGPFASH